MKRKFTLLLSLFIVFFSQVAFSQTTSDPQATVYATINSGAWNANNVWETYSSYAQAIAASPGSGTAYVGTTGPSGTHDVLIRAGHTITMGGANRGCKSIIVQSGGKLWANETSARRLQIGQGGTGFVYPITDTVQVDGTLGGPSDGVYFETGTATKYVNVSGSGSIDIQRIRTIGGAGSTGGGVMNFTIDANINLWQSVNYALSIVYNPATTDNYTITIKPSRVVTVKTVDGTFHNSQNTSSYGQYTYNIQGALDLSANTQTANNISANILAPAPATSKIALYIDGGTLKTGAAFKADTTTTQSSLTSTGVLDFQLINGGTLDASAASTFRVGKTSDGAGGYKDLTFAMDATSSILAQVSNTQVKFPLGIGTSPNSAFMTNVGTADTYTGRIKSTIDHAPSNPTKVVNRQWDISEANAGGSSVTLALSWVTADQASGFSPAGSVVIMHWNGSSYDSYPATVTGTGTAADPYVATTAAGAITSFSPFIVANGTAVPTPVTFISTKAYGKNNGVQVEWTTAEESAILNYVVERSNDGRNFSQAGVVASTNRVAASYSWFDASPNAGDNYYRIRAVELDGGKYTGIMKVSIGEKVAALIIASNPVRGGQLNIQLAGMQAGTYSLRVFNNAGQQVAVKSLSVEGSTLSQTIALPYLSHGVYSVQLSNGAINLTKKIVVE